MVGGTEHFTMYEDLQIYRELARSFKPKRRSDLIICDVHSLQISMLALSLLRSETYELDVNSVYI